MTIAIVLAALAATPHFGDAGTWVPSGSMSIDHSAYDPPGDFRESGTSISYISASLYPTVDYFFWDDVSVGIGVGAGAFFSGGDSGYTLRASLGFGYHLELSETVGLYPRIALEGGWGRSESHDFDHTNSSVSMNLAASVPMIFHADHFFIGAGPRWDRGLYARSFYDGGSSKGGTTSHVGLTTVLGGWF